jgi:outer membrane immunogenic protein
MHQAEIPMKKHSLGLFGTTLTSAIALASANAADSSGSGGYKDGYVPVVSWTGFYLGAHIGGAWGDLKAIDRDGFNLIGDQTKLTPSGVFGGATAGVNFQRGPILFGVEGDIGWLDFSAKRVMPASARFFGGDTGATIDGGVYGDMTVRLGYLFAPTILVYGKGGAAMYDGNFHVDDNCSTPPCGGATINTGNSKTFLGWTVGGGVEYLVMPGWTIKAEYQFFDFGRDKVDGVASTGNIFRFDAKDFTANTVKVGFNYHLWSSSEPLK